MSAEIIRLVISSLEPRISLFKSHFIEVSFSRRKGNILPATKVLIAAALFIVLLLLIFSRAAHPEQILFNEDFDTLANWTPVTFPGIDKHSEFNIFTTGSGNILVARSNASASGIRYIKEFDVYEYPVVRWRWKVDNVYQGGDLNKKSGNDFPLRVYIMFKYEENQAPLVKKGVYGLARIWYGEYPPHSSINYIWANKRHGQAIYPSPYTDKSKLIILRAGKAETGMWVEEEVNIIEDYKKAFAVLPPHTASIAIMNDSDNTGESSVSYLDFIRVLKSEKTNNGN